MRDFYRGHPEVWDGAHSIELIDKHSLTPLVKVAQETHTLLMVQVVNGLLKFEVIFISIHFDLSCPNSHFKAKS